MQLNEHVLDWKRAKKAAYMRAWVARNPDYREKIRSYYSKEKRAQKWAEWKTKNRDKILLYRKATAAVKAERMKRWRNKTGYNKKHYEKNRDALLVKMRSYYHANKDRIREKIKSDPFYSIKRAVRHAVERITKRGHKKNAKSEKYLGCSWLEARAHIEDKFKPGMSWNNFGAWEIDHIRPIASFDFSKPESAMLASRWDNLQPLWKHENRSKHAKAA